MNRVIVENIEDLNSSSSTVSVSNIDKCNTDNITGSLMLVIKYPDTLQRLQLIVLIILILNLILLIVLLLILMGQIIN